MLHVIILVIHTWYLFYAAAGVSTWTKPAELEGIEFTDPVPDITAAKQKVSAH